MKMYTLCNGFWYLTRSLLKRAHIGPKMFKQLVCTYKICLKRFYKLKSAVQKNLSKLSYMLSKNMSKSSMSKKSCHCFVHQLLLLFLFVVQLPCKKQGKQPNMLVFKVDLQQELLKPAKYATKYELVNERKQQKLHNKREMAGQGKNFTERKVLLFQFWY